MTDPDTDLIARLRARLARATPGPWQLQDGCSWRRIGTQGHDGNVLCPSTYSRSDRHPDLCAGKGEDIYANLELIVEAVNALPAILTALESRSPVSEERAREVLATHLDADCQPIAAMRVRERRDCIVPSRVAIRAMFRFATSPHSSGGEREQGDA